MPSPRRAPPSLALTFALATCVGSGGLGPVDRGSRTVALGAAGGSGVTGSATITPEAGGATATVAVTLHGLAAGSWHVGHVHRGSCAQPGEIDVTLSPVAADADGSGAATSTGVPIADLEHGYALQYHITLDPPSAAIACADLGVGSVGEAGGGREY